MSGKAQQQIIKLLTPHEVPLFLFCLVTSLFFAEKSQLYLKPNPLATLPID